jgi:predicted nucleic acid-binding protein
VGLILDSTVFIAAERRGLIARQTLADIGSRFPGEQFSLSVITLIELAHGAARADTPERRARRQQYLSELALASSIHPVTASIALRAGQIDGENTANGVRVALADLLIGVTALELGYKIATANLRHFHAIPGLAVVSL